MKVRQLIFLYAILFGLNFSVFGGKNSTVNWPLFINST